MTFDPLTNTTHSEPGGNDVAGGYHRFTPVDPLRVFRLYAGTIMITSVLSLLLGLGLWYGLRQYAPRYTSEAQLIVTGGVTDPYQPVQQVGSWRSGMDMIDSVIRNQIVRIGSNEVISNVLRRDDVRSTAWFGSFGGNSLKATEDFMENLKADKIRGSTLISLSFTAGNEADPPVILDAIISVYLEKMSSESLGETEGVRQSIVRQRDRADQDLRQVEEQLKQFKIQNDLSALESRNHEATIAYKMLAEQKVQLEVTLEQARASYEGLIESQKSGATNYSPQQLAEAEADPAVAIRDQRLRALREQREVYLDNYGDQHRAVQQIDLQIQAAEQEKQRQIERILRQRQELTFEETKRVASSLESQLQAIHPRIESSRARLRDLSQKIEEYRRIEARAKEFVQRRAKAEEMLNAMRLQSDRPDSTQVRRYSATAASKLSFPKGVVIVPGVVFAMVGLVTGFAFLKETLDQRIKSPADVALLPDCELLGVIPDATEDPTNPKSIEGIVRIRPTGLISETFRQVRSALLTAMEQHGHKTLMLVGSQAKCGISAVVQNLALSMAYDGKKVLVLDANFRRPSQHTLFDITIEPGLIDVLDESVTFEEAAAKVEVAGLEILPVGRPRDAASEVFESSAFSQLLQDVRSRYDVVIIDVPPALLTSDCALMAKHVDTIAVVVRAMEDKRGMVGRMLRQLGGHRAEVLGVILNGVRTSAGGYFRKSYQEFYRYHQAGTPSRVTSIADPDLIDAAAEK